MLDGIQGRLVPPADPEALAAAIDGLAADPPARHRMGASGIARIAAGWDLDAGADRLAGLLRTTLPRPTAAPARPATVLA